MQRNLSRRLVRLQAQSVTTEDSPLSSLAALRTSSPPVLEEVLQPAFPILSTASSTSETPNMEERPECQQLTVEQMLMNLQNSITAMQQRAAQTDANITRLTELFDTRIPPPLEEESEAEEDPHAQPVMVEDPNNPGRLIVYQNPRIVHAPAANPNLVGGIPTANPDIAALMAKMAKLEESIAKAEKVKVGGIDLDRLCLYPNAKLPEKFKMPDLAKFDGSGDPRTHLYRYHAAMKLRTFS
ncbi:hypothetical protein RHMOL_Rhmol02G0180500 [Rhododendron molle]|uniref:Uncharacterized protein n=1 Tax=Rhododendron molle TaxID=49168 RepID=A0ACC0PTU9_RHOML|nr:hypothetical protein RHMOL_Rhmol02G0180500 [Rhododendron molle]